MQSKIHPENKAISFQNAKRSNSQQRYSDTTYHCRRLNKPQAKFLRPRPLSICPCSSAKWSIMSWKASSLKTDTRFWTTNTITLKRELPFERLWAKQSEQKQQHETTYHRVMERDIVSCACHIQTVLLNRVAYVMNRRWYYEERSSYPLRKPAENVQRDSCEKNQQTPMRVSCTITQESNDALIVMPTSIPNFCGNCVSRINTNYILLKRSSWRRLASTGTASTGTAHILNGLGIDSDLAPSAMSVRKSLKSE